MAPLPKAFSAAAIRIESAIHEGRAEDAMNLLARELEAGSADKVVQALAAKWIGMVGLHPGDAKKLRGGKGALPKEWLDVGEMVVRLQDEGQTYQNAIRTTVKHFGYGERHTQECAKLWKAASAEE